ncbi:hypothetical protein HPP92_006494 [Vanilla planifolia]|uniref:Uncharacterized protein n=1 Tax=Vanilla planifolia TaxID=51239 RepID=A0A835RQS3_VANPL|nr:hypothetical protein HPP92_006494 [Vanilla planifolia]
MARAKGTPTDKSTTDMKGLSKEDDTRLVEKGWHRRLGMVPRPATVDCRGLFLRPDHREVAEVDQCDVPPRHIWAELHGRGCGGTSSAESWRWPTSNTIG